MTIQDKAKKFNKIPAPIDLDDTNRCQFCEDTGMIVGDIWDENSHTYVPVGEEPCECQDKIGRAHV